MNSSWPLLLLLLMLPMASKGFLSWPRMPFGSGASACARIIDGIPMCDGYPTHETMLEKLKRLQAAHPDLVAVDSIGQSVQDRNLTYVKIGRGVSKERPLGVPMVKLVGNARGDETLGRQLLLFLAEFLVVKYGADPRCVRQSGF